MRPKPLVRTNRMPAQTHLNVDVLTVQCMPLDRLTTVCDKRDGLLTQKYASSS